MRRMHERQNIGKVILIPEAKKAKEKPTGSDAPADAPAESAGKSATDETKKEEEEEAAAAVVDEAGKFWSFFYDAFISKIRSEGL